MSGSWQLPDNWEQELDLPGLAVDPLAYRIGKALEAELHAQRTQGRDEHVRVPPTVAERRAEGEPDPSLPDWRRWHRYREAAANPPAHDPVTEVYPTYQDEAFRLIQAVRSQRKPAYLAEIMDVPDKDKLILALARVAAVGTQFICSHGVILGVDARTLEIRPTRR
jgi:hypothetical protein